MDTLDIAMTRFDNTHTKSSWTKSNTATISVKDMRSMIRFTNFSKLALTVAAQQAMESHYDVKGVEALLDSYTSNDREMIEILKAQKECGETDLMHQLTERAWTAKGVVTHTPERITVVVNSKETEYKEVVLPTPVKTRPGMGNLVNAMSCMMWVEKGRVVPTEQSAAFCKVFAPTLIRVPKVVGYVENVAEVWDEAEHMRLDRDNKVTYRGNECSSAFMRFLAGISIPDYISLHSRMVTEVLNLYVVRNSFPTDSWRTTEGAKGKEPVATPTSVAQLGPEMEGEWGKMADSMIKRFKYAPKILIGPIKMGVEWYDHSELSVRIAKSAVSVSTAIRGGDSSYWSRMIACNGFSVASEYINRMRLLVALAAGVLKTSDKDVQIDINSSDLQVVDNSLVKLGYTQNRIKYLVPSGVKVSLARSPMNDRILCVAAEECVFISIGKSTIPSIGKHEVIDTVLRETMTMYRRTITHPHYCIFTPIMDGSVFPNPDDDQPDLKKLKARLRSVAKSVQTEPHDDLLTQLKMPQIVHIRAPHDLRAIMTTDSSFVLKEYFPKARTYARYDEFVKDVIDATHGSLTQIFSPAKLRSTSMTLLNILTFPVNTAAVRICHSTQEWEVVGTDDSRFYDGEDAQDENDDLQTFRAERKADERRDGNDDPLPERSQEEIKSALLDFDDALST